MSHPIKSLHCIEESTRADLFILECRGYAVYNPVALMDDGKELGTGKMEYKDREEDRAVKK